MSSTRTVFFISTMRTPFIEDDIEVLKKHFRVNVQIGSGWRAVFRIIRGAARSDVVFCWFASTYAAVGVAIANLYAIKSIVAVGGVDVACDRELNYGIWLSSWRSRFVRFVFRRASDILVVDPSLGVEARRLAGYPGDNILYLPTGYNTNFWKGSGEKIAEVLTVAIVRDERTFRLKGLDLLLEAAKRMSGTRFVIVGLEKNISRALSLPGNVECHSPVDRKDLLPFYQKAKVYCQPSRREGLPNALCEAMLCECIPVGTNINGIPTAIGATGILVETPQVDVLTLALQKALAMPAECGVEARMRIVSLFPAEKREASLRKLLEQQPA